MVWPLIRYPSLTFVLNLWQVPRSQQRLHLPLYPLGSNGGAAQCLCLQPISNRVSSFLTKSVFMPVYGDMHRKSLSVKLSFFFPVASNNARGSSSPQKPPIPEKPPPIARKPSLKPALKGSPSQPTTSDYNQITPQQVCVALWLMYLWLEKLFPLSMINICYVTQKQSWVSCFVSL